VGRAVCGIETFTRTAGGREARDEEQGHREEVAPPRASSPHARPAEAQLLASGEHGPFVEPGCRWRFHDLHTRQRVALGLSAIHRAHEREEVSIRDPKPTERWS
jgi:hypothetical protein